MRGKGKQKFDFAETEKRSSEFIKQAGLSRVLLGDKGALLSLPVTQQSSEWASLDPRP